MQLRTEMDGDVLLMLQGSKQIGNMQVIGQLLTDYQETTLFKTTSENKVFLVFIVKKWNYKLFIISLNNFIYLNFKPNVFATTLFCRDKLVRRDSFSLLKWDVDYLKLIYQIHLGTEKYLRQGSREPPENLSTRIKVVTHYAKV